jgi:hypothetical protein
VSAKYSSKSKKRVQIAKIHNPGLVPQLEHFTRKTCMVRNVRNKIAEIRSPILSPIVKNHTIAIISISSKKDIIL